MDSVSRDMTKWMAQMPPADRGVEELRQRIGRMSRLFDGLLDHLAEEHHISRADWAALSVIIRSDEPCTPTELARTLELTSGTVSTRIKRLTEAGLIEGAGDGTDARSRPIRATASGHKTWASATSARTDEEASVVRSALTNAQLTAVNQRLASILEALEVQFGTVGRHDIPRPE
ncbi:MarR family transcriptional regulator [Rhodococcus sp. G-MC3]|uniref:MarR family winged helix-turn-helix transcriptional regulator n=1 Tax=Rhodococcus sp. G-MC3 TaxID=3046209 RepID=UPI0024B950C2|nr:MarR family transcriptional regulator [Rhodococcus sp. G-MC3]MDJ0395864.1 MarR family transcriptional regulator [Rhodococcus sp. G-MC3]